MGLQKYKTKRNFSDTPEPEGGKAPKSGGLKFVVQRHQASRLHYDFRLEMEGVLKSWAVPKGPSLNPADKRLAMMVEDHPYSYRTFEGEIPKGNYGAGIVEIWDEGTYHALETTDRKESEKTLLKQLKEGSIKIVMQGKKLKGEFALVKLKKGEDNAWLLIKHKDKYAVEEYNSEDHVSPRSKIKKQTPSKGSSPGRSAATKARTPKAKAKKEDEDEEQGHDPMPHKMKPMLARLTDKPFDKEGWIYEIKWDGYRAVAEIENGKVELYSRNLLSFNQAYAPIVKSLEKLGHNAILDGEVVVLDAEGNSRFQLLQKYGENRDPNLYYYVFDLLYLDGHDLRELPLLERKELLKSMLPDLENVRYSDHIEKEGLAFFKLAEQNKIEGIMAKNGDSTYFSGRTGEWLKIKTSMRQEAVIAGYTEPTGSRRHFGSLVLGVYDEKGKLKYIGQSGGGFDTAGLKNIKAKLDKLETDSSPFSERIRTRTGITWVKPKLVCEISFSEWTGDGHMRHPVFLGLREDKDAKQVVREREVEVVMEDRKPAPVKAEKKAGLKKEAVNKESAKSGTKNSKVKTVVQAPKSKPSSAKTSTEVKINGKTLVLTNLQKIYWPEEKYTKGDLINYYREVAKVMLPYLKDRPQSLHRHPNGIRGQSFFQKDMGDDAPEWAETIQVHSESNDKMINYLLCQNEAALVYMANLGCIEINPWTSRTQSLLNPDYIVIDLDPGENTFEEVIETAIVTKDVLDRAGVEAFCKTSGATGIHIYIPMGAKYTFDEGKDFAHIIAQLVNEQLPELTSLERSPKSRPKQIYVDFLQNRRGQTLASVYSVRPKPGASVSTPLKWEELKPGLHPTDFTIKTIPKRLAKVGDIFKGIMGKGIDIQKCLKRLGA
jgi:bifunctional non-homologous end joining protein LigD